MKKTIILIAVFLFGLSDEVVKADFVPDKNIITANTKNLSDDISGNLTQCIDVSGDWSVTNTTSDEPNQNVYIITLNQTECQLTAELPGGTLTGTINENVITLNGTLKEEGGTSTVEMSVAVASNGRSFQGTYSYNWTDGFDVYNGTTELTGNRIDNEALCADVRGEWIITEIARPDNCSEQSGSKAPYIITIEQQGCVANVRTPIGEFRAVIDGNDILWTALLSEEDGTTTINFALTAEGNGLSGTASWIWGTENDTCGGMSTLYGTRQISGGTNGNSASQFINSDEGGIISVRNFIGDIISLDIPPGALPNSTTIRLTALDEPASDPIASNIFPGVIIEPDGQILNEPARLKVRLAHSLPEPELSRLFWVRNEDFVLFISNQSFDTTQIEGEIHHFSPYSGGLPSKDEIIQQAELLAEAQDLGLLSDPYGWLDVYDIVNGLLQVWEILEVLGNDELADSYFNGALGALEQGALEFLNMSIPSAPCGQYHSIVYKYARLVNTLLDDPMLTREFMNLQTKIDGQCIGQMVGTYSGNWTEAQSGCQDPKDNGRRGSSGSIIIDSQSGSTFRGHSDVGFSLSSFSGSMKPIGFVRGISTYSLSGNATYRQQEVDVDDYGNTVVRTTSGSASFSGIWAGDIISLKWTFQDTKGDTCGGAGSGEFTK